VAAWSRRTRAFERREWILPLPAHPAEVAGALAAAEAEHEMCVRPEPLVITSEDSERLIVSFVVPLDKPRRPPPEEPAPGFLIDD
jgi:hypothetical protein